MRGLIVHIDRFSGAEYALSLQTETHGQKKKKHGKRNEILSELRNAAD